MGKLQVMDHTGHTTIEFDAQTKDGVSEAMERFNELVGQKKYTAGERIPGSDGKFKLTRSFNPDAEEIIMMPPLQGG